ncbi:hypothetical protein H9P43_005600 [Blastocladiella emersonii ATCC 22665]|nr:hypothetical protein H9P43_005600 [Blastocladiella emersonii ATCC 22665]
MGSKLCCVALSPCSPNGPGSGKMYRHSLSGILRLMGCKNPALFTDQVFARIQSSITTEAAEAEPKVSEHRFFDVVASVMAEHGLTAEQDWLDLELAYRVQNRRQSITLLIGGTSGSGKSTLASLTASRLGISTVLSTDSIRHLLRTTQPESECPLLWASSYNAGDALTGDLPPDADRVIAGYEAQNALLFDKLDDLIGRFEARGESLILEGVHLSPRVMERLMARHASCIAFLIFIGNESKHLERFAVRTKYMTLEPRENKYVQHFGRIRRIQQYQRAEADRCLIPSMDNTSVDRSLSTLHRTILNVFTDETAVQSPGAGVYDSDSQTTPRLRDAYASALLRGWSSKGMLQRIYSKRRADDDGHDRAPAAPAV